MLSNNIHCLLNNKYNLFHLIIFVKFNTNKKVYINQICSGKVLLKQF